MHGHAGLAAARAAHHAHHRRIVVADGGVLLRLNGGHDLAHVVAAGPGEDVQQHVVVDGQLGVHVVLELTVFHAVLALEGHPAQNPAAGAVVGHLAGHGIVVQAAHRRAPVVHQQVALLILQAVQADDDLLQLRLALLHEVHAGEEGVHQHPAVALGHALGELPAGGKAVHLHGQLLQILHRELGRAHAQLLPGVGNDRLDGLQVAARHFVRLLDERQHQLLHPRGVRLFLAEILQLFHILPPGCRCEGSFRAQSFPIITCGHEKRKMPRPEPRDTAQRCILSLKANYNAKANCTGRCANNSFASSVIT